LVGNRLRSERLQEGDRQCGTERHGRARRGPRDDRWNQNGWTPSAARTESGSSPRRIWRHRRLPPRFPKRERSRSAGPRLIRSQRIDLLVGWKAACLLLRKRQPAIDCDFEHATDTRHQFDLSAVLLDQSCPRTEGPRFIVSGLAPLDTDFHFQLSSWVREFPAPMFIMPAGAAQRLHRHWHRGRRAAGRLRTRARRGARRCPRATTPRSIRVARGSPRQS
jgi:hypothetical protein